MDLYFHTQFPNFQMKVQTLAAKAMANDLFTRKKLWFVLSHITSQIKDKVLMTMILIFTNFSNRNIHFD